MADETFEPDVLRVFGGLCTVVARGQLGKGMSPACNDVEFFPAVVQSRPGYALRYTDTSPFQGIATFIDQSGKRYTVTLQDTGKLAYDGLGQNLAEILTTITSDIGKGLYMKARTAFGRLIACFSDGEKPQDFPVSWNLLSDYRGLATSPPTRPFAAAVSATGGTVVEGKHYLTLTFEDDLGYVTKAGPPYLYDSTGLGTKKIDLSSIQLGPTGTVRRRIWATAKDQGDLYSLGQQSGFIIDDNSTTTATIDFNDTDLVSNGEPYAARLTLAEPRIAAGLGQYGNRLALHGVYQTFDTRIIKVVTAPTTSTVGILGPTDCDFDAEMPGTVAGSPWTVVVPGGTGSGLVQGGGTRSKFLKIVGESSLDPIGHYEQTFTQAASSTLQETQYFLSPGTHVGLVVRVKASKAGMATGGIRFTVIGVTTTNSYLDIVIPAGELTTTWATRLISGFGLLFGTDAIDPKDTQLKIIVRGSGSVVGGSPIPAGEWVGIDFFRFVDARYPFDSDRVWFSSSIQQPGEFDLVASPLEIALGNGEKITGLFEQSGNYYVLKQRSWWVTSDNAGDPSSWNLDNVSPIVGSPSFFGWDVGPDFAIVCDLSGVYKFTGGAPEKISDEIENRWQEDLDTENAHKLWCVIDPNKKIVRIGIPVKNGAGLGPCHEIFTLNYVEGWDSGVPSGGVGRKWSVDTVASTGGAIIQMDALQRRFNLFGKRSSTNVVVAPNILTKPPWTDNGCDVPATLGTTTDPFGGSGGATSIGWAGGGNTQLLFGTAVGISEGEYYVISFWAKSGTPIPITVKSTMGVSVDPDTGAYIIPPLPDQSFTPTSKWVRYVFRFGPAYSLGGNAGIWLDFGSPTDPGSVNVYGMQLQLGPSDKGFYDVSITGLTPGESGFVSVPGEAPDYSPRLTDDWDNILNPTYTTWAFQSDIGRSLFDKIVFRISGRGNLLAAWLRPDDIVQYLPASTAPNTAPLLSPARYDIELGDNLEDIHAAVQLSTYASGAWWSLSRLAVLLKPSPYSTLRR